MGLVPRRALHNLTLHSQVLVRTGDSALRPPAKLKMATGPDGRELAADASPLSASPEPRYVHSHLEAPPGEIEGVRASPTLSRKTLDALGAENESSGGDPENYPLHTPWTFWFDRYADGGGMREWI